ncbi:MAG: MBL fold metallo-hydrolase [Vicinamibacteria bacterium]|nr:MBL fold metallo-hydrolase [Vicinamibacteria bacterium]
MWTRRQFLETSSFAAALGVAARGAFAQAPPAVTGTFTALRGNTGYFSGRGGTIGWLIAPDGLVVVDTQFPDTAQLCLDGIKSRASRSIDLLVNTHHHGDHTGGNAVFRPHVGGILAHANVPGLQQKAAAAPPPPGQPPPAAPTVADKTYDKVWEQAIGKETLRLKYYGPAHTSGDSVVTFVKANVAHMGDLMFNKRHPFIDRPSGASITNWITVLESTVKDHAKDTTYIFGHAKDGQPVTGDQGHLLEMRNYLTAVLDVTRKAIADGKSRDEAMTLGPLPKFEDYMEAPPRLTLATVLGIAYDELKN